jgi:hypothetical protein
VGNQRLILVMLSAYLLAASNSGCQLVHPQPPIDVEVRDAETKTPIEGAHVCVWHSSIHAVASSGNTGPDGKVRIPAPPVDDTPLLYEAVAKGFLTRQTDEPAERTPSGAILELYSAPRPILELVVPNGYQGVIAAKVRVKDDCPSQPRQRLFSFSVPPSGVIEAVVPPIFGRGVTPDIRFVYADGTPLSRNAKEAEIGCRCLKSDPDSDFVFVIGTQWQADEIRRSFKRAGGPSMPTARNP